MASHSWRNPQQNTSNLLPSAFATASPVGLTFLSLPLNMSIHFSAFSTSGLSALTSLPYWCCVSSERNEVGISQVWFERKGARNREGRAFKMTKFQIAHSKWLKKQGHIQEKSYSVQDSGEFRTTEFEIAGFNCNDNNATHAFHVGPCSFHCVQPCILMMYRFSVTMHPPPGKPFHRARYYELAWNHKTRNACDDRDR